MIYYLAQAYSSNPLQAIEDAYLWVDQINSKIISHAKWGTDAVFSPVMHTHHFDYDHCRQSINLGYVEWDLALCAGWLHHDAGLCDECLEDYGADNGHCGHDVEFRHKHDSGLTLLFADSCLYRGYRDDEMLGSMEFWGVDKDKSKGALFEYQWAKLHHVRCLLLDPFLHGEEVEI